jgi:hypothetical protein
MYMLILIMIHLMGKNMYRALPLNVYMLYQRVILQQGKNRNMQCQLHNNLQWNTLFLKATLHLDMSMCMGMLVVHYNNLLYNRLFLLNYHQRDTNRNTNMIVVHYIPV